MMLLEGPKATITALAFSPDGNELAVGAKDGTIALTTVFDGTFRTLGSDTVAVNAVSFDATGAMLLYGSGTGWFGFQRTGEETWDVHAPPKMVATTALAFLNEKTLVLGGGDRIKAEPGQLELHDLVTGKRREPWFREPSGVRAIAVHSDLHTVAWTNAANRLSIWNTLTLEPRHVGLTHTAPSLGFHPDGEVLAVAVDYGVKLFDVASRDEKRTLKGHSGRVAAVAYSPDGRMLATASWDKTVRLWDAASGAERAAFDWGIGRVQCLAFAPDGLRLVAGGENGLIALWDME
ncbi:WD40 repeat domain-containing protein [Limnoglobus roseus]|uniref:WD40 repeat domain-containing protein n=1 Tax=Limnoglobus roseus TaxID=2598579 RepID=A0A5C1AEI9_9BACT|nr:hypothetical protein [Limnoglobus roseus]QEL17005.1 WD40 repeat domain-containing protein [Limnoglobus roseus]